ncbi:hypothetical protein C1H76_6402 [Elsinoe australis]|uniref:Phosphatidic acid phosphatase type 2/haloperoxidase domain-containing protein n=1 Tax=Elsinoe australis TaxID=40998 RepID=A0A4U7ASN8_9PEZI|nr:hypothetical protein C1H76_6402 [Elsinoe australis]
MDNSRWTTVQRLWKQSYASDYLGFIILLILYINLQIFQEPFHRLFYLNDHRIQYPHAEVERVPVSLLFVYGGGIPLLIIVVWLLLSKSPIQKAHITVLSFLISLILTSFLTDASATIVKNSVGRPRPDLIARCKPRIHQETSSSALKSAQKAITISYTMGGDHFPQGTALLPSADSDIWASSSAPSQVHALRPNVDLARMILVMAPFVCAALIAISRLEDYRHDVFDVSAGSIIGVTIAYLTWRRHYPKLSSVNCATPYALQAVENKQRFRRVRDEEEGAGPGRDYEVGSDSE